MRGATRFLTLPVLLGAPSIACAGAQPCSLIPTFADSLTPSTELHISTTGSNTTGDGSAASPFATIAFAASKATPGTAIVIHAGAYPSAGFIEDLDGAPQAPIWIGGAAGEARPIIQGGSEGLHLIECSYLILHDLEVTGSSANGINCDDGGDTDNPLAAHHIIFRNLHIHDIGGSGNQDGLKLSGLNDFFVLDCTISTTGGGISGSLIDMVGCHHGLIAGCTLADASGSGIQAKGGSENVEVRWCTFTDCGQRAVNIGGSTGFEFFRPPLDPDAPNAEARNIRIFSNLFNGSVSPINFVGAVDCTVSHNTIVHPGNWIIRILQETTSSGGFEFLPCGGNTFAANIAWFDLGEISTPINIGGNTAPNTFTFSNNLWHAFDNPAASKPNLPAPEPDGIYGQPPGFTNAAADEYSITAIGAAAGAATAPAPLPADIAGRCYCAPASLGAWEAPLAADINRDGAVNSTDLNSILKQFGQPASPTNPADIDNDGAISSPDLNAILASFGQTCT